MVTSARLRASPQGWIAACALGLACACTTEEPLSQHDAASVAPTALDASEGSSPEPTREEDATQGATELVDAGETRDASPPAADASVAPDASQHDAAPDAATVAPCLATKAADYATPGPYAVRRETVALRADAGAASLSDTFTIFSPDPLESACPHPFAAWANASGVSGVDTYAFYQENAASWGVVVIAGHDANAGPEHHARAIDHLLAASRDPSSRFYQKLSERAGAGGHVQGGSIASLAAADHPNVEAIIALGPNGLGEMGERAFLCLSGTNDIGRESCRGAIPAAAGPALAAIWQGGDRTTTQTVEGYTRKDPGTLQMMRLYTAWYRCFLADDARACGLFRGGQDCGLCAEAGWAEIVSAHL